MSTDPACNHCGHPRTSHDHFPVNGVTRTSCERRACGCPRFRTSPATIVRRILNRIPVRVYRKRT